MTEGPMSTDRVALVLMVGAPGSGKSTWVAERFAARDVFSLDAMRRLLTGAELDMDATGPAVAMLRILVEHRMARRLTTVIDSTNTRAAYRWPLSAYARAAGVPVVAVTMAAPLEECLHRNAYRGRLITPAAPYADANGTEVPPADVARLHAEAIADPPCPGRDVDAVLTVTHDGFLSLAGDLPPALLREPWLAAALATRPATAAAAGPRPKDLDVWRRICLNAYTNLTRDTEVTMGQVDQVLTLGARGAAAADTSTPEGSAYYSELIAKVAAETGLPVDDVDAILVVCCDDAAEALS